MQSRPAISAGFHDKIIHSRRHGKEYKRIILPGPGKLAVEESMKRTLASTAGTVIAGKHLEGTFEGQ